MVRSPNETSSRSRLAKLLCDYRAFKTDENETATARWKTAENLGSLDTDPGRAGSVLVNSVNSADVEKAGDWSEMDSDGTFRQMRSWKPERNNDVCARAIARAGDPTLANLSFHESVSVGQATEKKYKARVDDFLFLRTNKLALAADDEVDAAIVQYLNTSYDQGRPVGHG